MKNPIQWVEMGDSFDPKKNRLGACPHCGAPGLTRERRINGNDTCMNMHKYKSNEAVK